MPIFKQQYGVHASIIVIEVLKLTNDPFPFMDGEMD